MVATQTVYIDEMTVGRVAESRHVVTEKDINLFAEVSHDDNPLHVDAEFAKTTQFGERIAHGMLSVSYISAVLGTQMPGVGAIYLSQSVKFKAPVKIGDEVHTVVTVTDVHEGRARVTLTTNCYVGDKLVTEGEAQVIAPRRPA